MRVGQLVKEFISEIIEYCEKVDQEEIDRLKDFNYSKKVFGINFPFWLKLKNIEDSKRYWSNIYKVNNDLFRVCSQWYSGNTDSFTNYLIKKNLTTIEEITKLISNYEYSEEKKIERKIRQNSRYRGNAIGNAQNLVIRNILSNLGNESFNENNWGETKAFFNNRCAYCGEEKKLEMEHAIPINKMMLGEHRLGNLVPSCHECNGKKGSLRYDQFLKGNQDKIKKIEDYMRLKDYEPLSNSEKSEIIAELLKKAYLDTAEVAKRYVQIIELVQNNKE